jgi:hemolysin III
MAISSSHAVQLPMRPFSLAERIADAVVHGVGIAHALALGTILIVFAAIGTARPELPAIILYLLTLLIALGVSLAFNVAPVSRFKAAMHRLDQAAIFLFIAGSYTPFLAILGATTEVILLAVLVWGAASTGIALRLFAPSLFLRLAVPLYLGIGWSGVLVFGALLAALPPASFWLTLAGGIAYSTGIIFHLWKRLAFQNVVWHVFVVAGATLQLWAIFYCLVIARL